MKIASLESFVHIAYKESRRCIIRTVILQVFRGIVAGESNPHLPIPVSAMKSEFRTATTGCLMSNEADSAAQKKDYLNNVENVHLNEHSRNMPSYL